MKFLKNLLFITLLFNCYNVFAQFPSNCNITDMYIILSEENSPYSSMVVKFDTKADVTSTSCLGNKPSGEGVVVSNQYVYIARRTFPDPTSVIDVYNTNTGVLENTFTFPPTLSSNPHDLAISPDGTTLYAAFTESTTAGQYFGVFRAINATTGAINYSFNFPVNNRIWGVTIDPSGNIYVTKMIETSPKIMQLIKIDPITYNQTILFSQTDPTTMTPPAAGFLGIAYYPPTNSLWAYAPYYNINGVMMNFSLSGTLLSTCVVESGVQPVKYGPDGLIYTGSLNSNTCVGQFNPNTCAYSTFIPQPSSGGASTKGLAFACASQVFCIPQTCSVSQVTATPGTCNPANNQYSVTGSITFSNPPSSGTMTVSVGSISQTFNAPFTSPQTYTLNGLAADGASHTVTVVFSADGTCTSNTSFTAPNNCTPLLCSSSVAATPGTCNSSTNQYTLNGSVTFTNPPSSGTLTVQIAGGGSQTFNPPFTSPKSYSIAGQTSDGANHTVTATFSADANCTKNATYTAPSSCSNCPPMQCGTTTIIKN